MVVTWAALAWTMRQISPRPPRTVLGFGFAFRLIALFAEPVMEDDHHRFLWDGHRFAATGNPYAEAPQARFGDDTIPAEFRTGGWSAKPTPWGVPVMMTVPGSNVLLPLRNAIRAGTSKTMSFVFQS